MKQSDEIAFRPNETLFFLAGGLNDRSRSTADVTADLVNEVRELYDSGGRRFRIAVLPESVPPYHDVAMRLNPAIRKLATTLSEQFKGIECRTSEWGVYFDRVMRDAAQYGFTNTKDACTGRTMFQENSTPCTSPRTHFYYHKWHPSTAVHAIVGAELLLRNHGFNAKSIQSAVQASTMIASRAHHLELSKRRSISGVP